MIDKWLCQKNVMNSGAIWLQQRQSLAKSIFVSSMHVSEDISSYVARNADLWTGCGETMRIYVGSVWRKVAKTSHLKWLPDRCQRSGGRESHQEHSWAGNMRGLKEILLKERFYSLQLIPGILQQKTRRPVPGKWSQFWSVMRKVVRFQH
ncbi:MAG: hypothetical protein CME32_13190 [Gimesia sp.]|nr:hypothetical protein [Gimesia sp.]